MSGSGGACVIGAHLIGHNANDYANKCLLNPHQEVLLDAIVLQILEIDTRYKPRDTHKNEACSQSRSPHSYFVSAIEWKLYYSKIRENLLLYLYYEKTGKARGGLAHWGFRKNTLIAFSHKSIKMI